MSFSSSIVLFLRQVCCDYFKGTVVVKNPKYSIEILLWRLRTETKYLHQLHECLWYQNCTFGQQSLWDWPQRPYSVCSLCLVSLDPPARTREDHTIHVSEESPASVSCPVSGNPYPTITWYKGNEISSSTMINTSNILKFPETVLDDNGWYTCFAENYLGNVSVTVELRVGKLYCFVSLRKLLCKHSGYYSWYYKIRLSWHLFLKVWEITL